MNSLVRTAFMRRQRSAVAVAALAVVVFPCLVDAFQGPSFLGLKASLPGLGRAQAVSPSFSPIPRLGLRFGNVAASMIRMDRKDGGATKISKPAAPGKVGNPNVGGGAPGGDREAEKGGAGVAVLTKPPETDKVNDFERKEAVDKEPIWRVLLHNDDVHTFDYVIDTIVKVVRTVTRKKAHRITMEAHKSGLATVTTTWKQLAREYSLGLQKAGLTSSIAPDKSNSC